MCTVSLLVTEAGWRCCHNRDELRQRLPAKPPQVQQHNGIQLIMPTDGNAGGSWVGVNERGELACILNRTLPGANAGAGSHSRGALVSLLLASPDAAAAHAAMDELNPRLYSYFRCIFLAGNELTCWTWQGDALEKDTVPAHGWHFWASSGLGDEVVVPAREQAFAAVRQEQELTSAAPLQDAYHRLRWPDASEKAPNMERVDACTVSLTEVSADAHAVQMRYFPGAPDHVTALPLQSLPIRSHSI